jgi:hypothetical protein
MKFSRRAVVLVFLLTALTLFAERKHSSAYRSSEGKIAHLEQNAKNNPVDPAPTELTAQELNAYLNEGGVVLPQGVHNVKLTSQPGKVNATAEVDFDELTAGKTQTNPLMMLFTGRHDVAGSAQAYGKNGRGVVHVSSVSIDGVAVPQRLLQYFADHYLKPRFGNNVGLDSNFALPVRINSAGVGENQVTLVQR